MHTPHREHAESFFRLGKLAQVEFHRRARRGIAGPLAVLVALVRVQWELMKRGWWVSDVVFISVTTDPARDIPEFLKRYAEGKGADSAGWHFITGDLATVARVHKVYGIYGQPKDKGLQDHALPTFVIDRKGIVLGAYGVSLNAQDVLSDLEKPR